MLSAQTSTVVRRTLQQRLALRCLTSTTGPIPVDVDHFVSGWNIGDIGDFTKPGYYNVQTYNKISEKVSMSVAAWVSFRRYRFMTKQVLGRMFLFKLFF